MHSVKNHLQKTAEYIKGIERTKLFIACAIAIGAAVLIVAATVSLFNHQTSPSSVTDFIISGEVTCLPHKVTNGFQTQECALGLHTDDNRYFALQNVSLDDLQKVGERINVKGALRVTSDNVYDIAGTIDVTSLTR